ncbi:MAG: phenylacetate-CoA oxygenase subunit PaaC [Chloroflexi bacterium]|nr:phenylacetate-CoA oxygenase subunit PaaC [Chloroflexota bacterium]
MNETLQQALVNQLIGMADDELILAHRNSEWTGHAPILEEDIAFANIAQDELGHATLWYEIIRGLTGDDPDKLVFFRSAAAFRNLPLVELPKGDWAFSMVRQYLFDAYEMVALPHLMQSSYKPMGDAAAKIRSEEIYHLRHTMAWLKRLGLGTEVSHQRTQNALNELWPYALALFVPRPDEHLLVEAGYVPDAAALQTEWSALVRPFLSECGLTVPADELAPGDRLHHTAYLTELLQEMQSVARLDPEAVW